jgi:hypothetical protein
MDCSHGIQALRCAPSRPPALDLGIATSHVCTAPCNSSHSLATASLSGGSKAAASTSSSTLQAERRMWLVGSCEEASTSPLWHGIRHRPPSPSTHATLLATSAQLLRAPPAGHDLQRLSHCCRHLRRHLPRIACGNECAAQPSSMRCQQLLLHAPHLHRHNKSRAHAVAHQRIIGTWALQPMQMMVSKGS